MKPIRHTRIRIETQDVYTYRVPLWAIINWSTDIEPSHCINGKKQNIHEQKKEYPIIIGLSFILMMVRSWKSENFLLYFFTIAHKNAWRWSGDKQFFAFSYGFEWKCGKYNSILYVNFVFIYLILLFHVGLSPDSRRIASTANSFSKLVLLHVPCARGNFLSHHKLFLCELCELDRNQID